MKKTKGVMHGSNVAARDAAKHAGPVRKGNLKVGATATAKPILTTVNDAAPAPSSKTWGQ